MLETNLKLQQTGREMMGSGAGDWLWPPAFAREANLRCEQGGAAGRPTPVDQMRAANETSEPQNRRTRALNLAAQVGARGWKLQMGAKCTQITGQLLPTMRGRASQDGWTELEERARRRQLAGGKLFSWAGTATNTRKSRVGNGNYTTQGWS